MFQSIFLSSLLLLNIPALYIYLMYIMRNRTKIGVKILYWLPIILLSVGLYIILRNPFGTDFTLYPKAMGIYIICYFLIVNPLVFLTVTSLLSFLFYKKQKIRKAILGVGWIVSFAIVFMLLYGSIFGRTQFTIKPVKYAHIKIPPSFNNYKIVQISDFHLGSWYSNTKPVQQIVDLVNRQNPDLIVFTGDLVNNKADEIDPFIETLSQLKATDGVYSVLGNHDYGPYYKLWKSNADREQNVRDLENKQAQMGWKLLNNEHTFLTRGNDSIALIGVENDGEPPFAQYGDLKKAAENTEKYFQILLSHNPTHWRREVLPETAIPLTLAGHTHAMQFQIGSFSLASKVYPEWSGMYTENDQSLYVNIGLGSVGPPLRWGAWPEITVITLNKKTP